LLVEDGADQKRNDTREKNDAAERLEPARKDGPLAEAVHRAIHCSVNGVELSRSITKNPPSQNIKGHLANGVRKQTISIAPKM
jgi:hypothetical protein